MSPEKTAPQWHHQSGTWLIKAATVTQTALSVTRTPELADERCLKKRTGRAKDGTRASMGKGIRNESEGWKSLRQSR
jgi:hypothetical protein